MLWLCALLPVSVSFYSASPFPLPFQHLTSHMDAAQYKYIVARNRWVMGFIQGLHLVLLSFSDSVVVVIYYGGRFSSRSPP